ncbi:MAG: cupin domain-containing protein [Gammaproteobacteria bacterium]|nr:cupin domain-containing protein [Gammaproteobacteria bacterium]
MSERTRLTPLSAPLTDSGGNGEKFEFSYRRIGASLGLEKLATSIFSVPPGKRAFPYHAHAEIEEMFLILEGEGTLRHEDVEYPVKAGDLIAAPCGEAHQLINTSDGELRYLAISTNDRTDVVKYPDSGKVMAYTRALEKPLMHMTRETDARDYFDGE